MPRLNILCTSSEVLYYQWTLVTRILPYFYFLISYNRWVQPRIMRCHLLYDQDPTLSGCRVYFLLVLLGNILTPVKLTLRGMIGSIVLPPVVTSGYSSIWRSFAHYYPTLSRCARMRSSTLWVTHPLLQPVRYYQRRLYSIWTVKPLENEYDNIPSYGR